MTRYSEIKNKIKRQEVYHNEKIQKNKVKKREKNVAAANGNEKEKEIPKTLESKREFDESLSLINSNQTGNLRINLDIQLDEEVEKDFENDEFNQYFTAIKKKKTIEPSNDKDNDGKNNNNEENTGNEDDNLEESDTDIGDDDNVENDLLSDNESETSNNDEETSIYTPKILITTSKRPSKPVYEFTNEFTSIFPNAKFVKRASCFDVKKLVEIACVKEFTDLIIVNHDRKEPNAITIVHLPNGPTAHFTLTSIALNKTIRAHGKLGPHKPELILNNFSTALGQRVGRMFGALFPPMPEFEGRQACTLHNQRDFIFFRRHRYIFRKSKETGLVEKADIQEIGPRFTLKLKWLQKGTFDRKNGLFEWVHKPELDTSRTKFHL